MFAFESVPPVFCSLASWGSITERESSVWQSTTLHCITLHCIILHCITLDCITLFCITLHCIALYYTAQGYTALHHTALHYNTEFLNVTNTRTCVRSQFCWLCATFSDLYMHNGKFMFFSYISLCWHVFILLRCTFFFWGGGHLWRNYFETEVLSAQKQQHLECLLQHTTQHTNPLHWRAPCYTSVTWGGDEHFAILRYLPSHLYTVEASLQPLCCELFNVNCLTYTQFTARRSLNAKHVKPYKINNILHRRHYIVNISKCSK